MDVATFTLPFSSSFFLLKYISSKQELSLGFDWKSINVNFLGYIHRVVHIVSCSSLPSCKTHNMQQSYQRSHQMQLYVSRKIVKGRKIMERKEKRKNDSKEKR